MSIVPYRIRKVALTIPCRMIGSIISTTIMSMGRVDIATVTSAVGAVVAPILFVIGSRYGIVGLSLAWLVVTPIMFMLNMFRALPILGLAIRDVFAEIWRPLLISGVMFLTVALLRSVLGALPEALVFVVLVAVGAFVYVAGRCILNRTASIEALGLLFPGRFARFTIPAAVAP